MITGKYTALNLVQKKKDANNLSFHVKKPGK